MGHTVEGFARTYAHVIPKFRGQDAIDPETLIERARDLSKRPKTTASPTTNGWSPEADEGLETRIPIITSDS